MEAAVMTTIDTYIDGRLVAPSDVQAWESRRASAVLNKLTSRVGKLGMAELLPGVDLSALDHADTQTRRDVLVTLKLRLGHAGLYALLKRELAVSEHLARVAVTASRGSGTRSAIRLVAPGCAASQFGAWFDGLTATNAEAEMIAACPDHYLLRGLPDGRQEVIETTGGSPTATRFLVDYATGGRVSIPTNPEYPVQIAGEAVLDDGLVIGAVRHQFRDVNGAMEALLTVEFPRVFPSRMVAEHRWHLATEFGNWITAFHQQPGPT
jgi:hypothetical protein